MSAQDLRQALTEAANERVEMIDHAVNKLRDILDRYECERKDGKVRSAIFALCEDVSLEVSKINTYHEEREGYLDTLRLIATYGIA